MAISNQLLSALPPPERARLMARMEPVELALRQVLQEPGDPIAQVYFIERGVVSLTLPLEGGVMAEVGLLNSEGMVGYQVALGAEVATSEAVVQVPGTGLRLSAADLRTELARGGLLQKLLLRCALTMHIQISRTAACNARHTLEERLARWLLMLQDKVMADVLPVTHELIAMMLGVRRPGVSVAVGMLERMNAISHDRGSITVKDRERLQLAACECYATTQAEIAPVPMPVAEASPRKSISVR